MRPRQLRLGRYHGFVDGGDLAGVDRGFGREAEGAGPAALTAETHQIVDVREWPVDGRDSGERGRVDHAGARIEQGVPG